MKMFSDASSIYLEQARLLLRILPLIRRYPDFALKGGTALNFYIEDLPRLSVDIDLAYVPILPRLESLNRITQDMENLSSSILRLMPKTHVTTRKTPEGHIRGLQIRSASAAIKVEPNHVIRGTVYPPRLRPLVPAAENLFEMEVDFPVLSLPDLYAGKICAALDRQHPRDLFDIRYLLDSSGITKKTMNALLVYIISHPRPMAEILSPNLKDIRETYKKEFRFMTREDVEVEELEDIRIRLIRHVHSALCDNDRKFLISVKSGEPDWSLHPVDHIRNLPAVQWKLRNIRTLSKTKQSKALDKLKSVLEENF